MELLLNLVCQDGQKERVLLMLLLLVYVVLLHLVDET